MFCTPRHWITWCCAPRVLLFVLVLERVAHHRALVAATAMKQRPPPQASLEATRLDGVPGRTRRRYGRTERRPSYPSKAPFRVAMSIFFIFSIASIARRAPGDSGSFNICSIPVGTTCQDSPYLSFSVQLELHRHHRARGSSVYLLSCVTVAGDRGDPRVLEHGDVEPRGLFGLVVEPETRCNAGCRHGVLPPPDDDWRVGQRVSNGPGTSVSGPRG
jgi:hypothetical protein